MTPPQFTISDGYLKELPRIKMPKLPTDVADKPYPKLKVKIREYEKHVALLRSYRLANPSDWDNVPMPIGEDQFKIEERWLYSGVYDEIKGHNTMGWVKVAIPTQPAKGQEEMWEDAIRKARDAYVPTVIHPASQILEYLRQHYILTPKQ